ncbi:hypothetical protein AB0F17_06760 [Nonomuraea sp. NPDC026600]|uniref:hypothetical protein n=1 Tax=Nonomuraea sp. NPDC026600 TaxID=3155363 RepID=UPI003400846F
MSGRPRARSPRRKSTDGSAPTTSRDRSGSSGDERDKDTERHKDIEQDSDVERDNTADLLADLDQSMLDLGELPDLSPSIRKEPQPEKTLEELLGELNAPKPGEPDGFAKSKRDSFLKSGAEVFVKPETPKIKISWNPKYNNPNQITVYRVQEGDTIGQEISGAIGWESLALDEFDDTKWVYHADGRPMIKGQRVTGGDPVFIDRADLVELTYKSTTTLIDDLAKRNSKELRRGFWEERRQELEGAGKVSFSESVPGINTKAIKDRKVEEGGHITVPAAEYDIVGFMSNVTVAHGQLAPFSVIINADGMEVVVSPDRSWGVEKGHVDKAKELNLNAKLAAKEILEVFHADDSFRPYLSTPGWLSDDQIHYVTPEEMGAVFVLKRAPESEDEVKAAELENGGTFNEGKGTPGVRIGADIYVQLNELGTGTEYHEAIHKLSHPALEHVLGHWFGEGLTEYFTRLLVTGLVRDGKIVRSDAQYSAQYKAIEALVAHAQVTQGELADAYFKGIIKPLYEKVATAAVHPPFSAKKPFSLDGFAARLDPVHAAEALKIFETACGDVRDDNTATTTTTTTTISADL